nr:hypothetical protein L203_00990 [Cryptococcus depauperatus CBS 7841]
MAIPSVIQDQDPADPLLLLPIPEQLPFSPVSGLPAIVSAIDAYLTDAVSSDVPSMPVIASVIRQATRNAQSLLNAARAGAAEAREELDQVDVRLREVEYERDRVRKETEKPIHSAMDSPSVETFFEKVEPSMIEQLSPTHEDHQQTLTITRLEHELEEILKREAQAAQLTKDRDAYIRAKKEIKMKTDAVDVHLGNFAKTANAVGSKVKDVAEVHAPTVSVSSGPS